MAHIAAFYSTYDGLIWIKPRAELGSRFTIVPRKDVPSSDIMVDVQKLLPGVGDMPAGVVIEATGKIRAALELAYRMGRRDKDLEFQDDARRAREAKGHR